MGIASQNALKSSGNTKLEQKPFESIERSFEALLKST
jgi:hypothetical protein